MAFIVWRAGRYAELLHSVREGRTVRQVRLAWLGADPAVTPALKAEVAAKHPQISVDWDKIAEALAQHPVAPDPEEERSRRLVAAVAEPVLHDWLTRYHRRIRRERVEVVEQEWWPEFRETLLSRPDLSDLLVESQLLDEAAYQAVSAAETNHERRKRAREEERKSREASKRAQLVAAVDVALEAIAREYAEGLEWARSLLGAYPAAEERAGDPRFLQVRAAEAVRLGKATSEVAERAMEIVLSAASSWSQSGRLPARLWDQAVGRLPVDVPAQLVVDRARERAGLAGGAPQEAERNAQVLLNLLDARRRDEEKRQAAVAPRSRRRR